MTEPENTISRDGIAPLPVSPYVEAESIPEFEERNRDKILSGEKILRAAFAAPEASGEHHDWRPFVMVSPKFASLYASQAQGFWSHKYFGNGIEGRTHFTVKPDHVTFGNYMFNPALLDCSPSTTVTPIPVFLFRSPGKGLAQLAAAAEQVSQLLSLG